MRPSRSPATARAGLDDAFTQKNTTFMTWNLPHLARTIKDASGIAVHGDLW